MVYGLRRPDVNRDWLFTRCRDVQRDPNGYLDVWSRGHYKSSLITFGLTIQDILNDPEVTFGIFSHTRPIAKGFLKQIKREFEDNEGLKADFSDILYASPHKESPQWSEDGGIIVKRKGNPKEATLEAWGLVDGAPTGKHFRRRVYDDVVTRESVTTPDQIGKTTEAWELSLNLGGGENIARYIGTRYHLADTYSVMLARGAVVERAHPATHNGRLDGRPVFWTEAQWAKKLQTMSRAVVAAQLLQNPMADEDATFKVRWLKSYELRPRTLNVYIMADPSKGRSATSDNTAIAVIGIAANGAKFLLDGYCHRMGLSQRWTYLKGLWLKWSRMPGVMHCEVGYERYGAQSDDEYFEERQRQEKVFFDIVELNWTRDGTQSKRDRVERLEPDFRNARFHLPICVWHEGKPQVWSIDEDVDSKTFGEVQWRDVGGLTSAQQAALDGGSIDLIAKAIKRKDEEGKIYDLTDRFIGEYSLFPFGGHDDLIDATSRIYDMEPRAPIVVHRHQTEQTVYHDS